MKSLRSIFVLGAALALIALIAAACGGGSSSSTSADTGATDAAGAAAQADELLTTTPAAAGSLDKITWNLPYEPSSIDPAKSFNYAENTAIANMCESLLRLNPDFSITPGLAESFTNPTSTTWVYKVRQGVTFWDGTPMTADDVAFSLNRHLDPDVGSYFAFYFVNVKSVKKTADDEVTVTLNKPDVLFNEAMATAAGAVSSAAAVKAAGQDYGTAKGGVMCTGPFAFGSWQSGTSISLTRNDTYWDSTLTAKAGALDLTFISDESTAVNALLSGEIDGQYFYTPPAGLKKLQDGGTATVDYGKSLVFWSLLTATDKGAFAKPEVRRALLAATDRAAIANVVFQGAAQPARVLSPPASWGYAKETFEAAYDAIPAPAVDLTAAKEEIAAAGADGASITIAAQGSSVAHSQTAEILKAAGAQIGLNITIKVIPVQQYGSLYWDPKAREGIDAFLSTWYGNVADPLDLYAMMGPGAPNNFNNYDNATVTSALDAAMGETDETKRAEQLVTAQTAITDDVVWFPLVYQNNIVVMKKGVTGAVASFPYLYYPWAVGIGSAG